MTKHCFLSIVNPRFNNTIGSLAHHHSRHALNNSSRLNHPNSRGCNRTKIDQTCVKCSSALFENRASSQVLETRSHDISNLWRNMTAFECITPPRFQCRFEEERRKANDGFSFHSAALRFAAISLHCFTT